MSQIGHLTLYSVAIGINATHRNYFDNSISVRNEKCLAVYNIYELNHCDMKNYLSFFLRKVLIVRKTPLLNLQTMGCC